MCGIAVILEGSALDIPPFAVDRMTAALHHRGPDERASVKLTNCHLGHTRLSIIDPAGGQQPMCDPSRRYWITFNGEIYNFRELRRELESRLHHFTTNSDTEVLLHTYIEFGAERMLAKLNGQFAFAIWDDRERTLFVARDRFGEKPLYWTRTAKGHVIFASEIKGILATGLIDARVDPESIEPYVKHFHLPPNRTIYSNVQTLPPAHAAIWKG